ncbi:MAG: DUF1599 domain-containing protein [Bacteroidales bacterium]|jgi:hypothetical protein|nr:DUF1599 domain-containing protein [Bacteroidales bacterium]
MSSTLQEFDGVIALCKDIFLKKMHDYDTAWRILRTSSITDLIYIKAQRIRSVQEKGVCKVDEDILSEFRGIINYTVMAQIQLASSPVSMKNIYLSHEEIIVMYDMYVQKAKDLLSDKNHDYDEAWRDMRISSITDIILMKLLRIKQIEDNNEKTLISEGLDANYYDILNYAVFALIKLT